MEATVLETISMGSEGKKQMKDAGDTVMASAFEQIFKVLPSSNAATLTQVSSE